MPTVHDDNTIFDVTIEQNYCILYQEKCNNMPFKVLVYKKGQVVHSQSILSSVKPERVRQEAEDVALRHNVPLILPVHMIVLPV